MKEDNKTSRTDILDDLIREMRWLMPKRPLSLTESYRRAELQATRILELLGFNEPGVNLNFILDLPKLDVRLGAGYKMEGLSGLTTFTQGSYLILVNKSDGHARRRFTLAHEFKHVLDYTLAPVIHRSLGYGDEARRAQQIEAICNHFAASLLMPRTWIKRVWTNGIQDLTALAGLFKVSEEAMAKRLRFLGYIDDEPREVRTYFRVDGTTDVSSEGRRGTWQPEGYQPAAALNAA